MAADEDVLAIALRDLILANISGFTLIPDQPFSSFLAFFASPPLSLPRLRLLRRVVQREMQTWKSKAKEFIKAEKSPDLFCSDF